MSKAMVLSLFVVAVLMAADVSGTWKFTVETDQGRGNPEFTLKQDGEQLTGTYTGLFGKANVGGTVRGEKIEFQFKVDIEGQSMVVKYSGVVESPTRMKGTVEFGDMGSGTWTAMKQ
jgi:hypothetical protein